MNTIKTINSSEQFFNSFDPQNALIAFYHAFNNQNLKQMENNWLLTDDASMSNPLGGIKRSWTAIKSVYQKIFNSPAKVFAEFYDFTIHETENMFCAAGRERGYLKINDKKIELAIRTSRIYQKIDNQWKQIHHHGSIDQADSLTRYQNTILQINSAKTL